MSSQVRELLAAQLRPAYYAANEVLFNGRYKIEIMEYGSGVIRGKWAKPHQMAQWSHCLRGDSPWTAESLTYFLGLRKRFGLESVPDPESIRKWNEMKKGILQAEVQEDGDGGSV